MKNGEQTGQNVTTRKVNYSQFSRDRGIVIEEKKVDNIGPNFHTNIDYFQDSLPTHFISNNI